MDHAGLCKTGKGIIASHNRIVNYIGKLCEHANVVCQIEKRNLVWNSQKRPADALLYSFRNGQDVAVDVGIASNLKESVSDSKKFSKLAPANQYYREKMNAFNKYTQRNPQHGLQNFQYVPFIVEQFGGIHPEAKNILAELANLIASRKGTDPKKTLNSIIKKLSTILQHFPLMYYPSYWIY